MNTKKRDSYSRSRREELMTAAPDAPLYERLDAEANKIMHIGPAKRAVALLREAADVLRHEDATGLIRSAFEEGFALSKMGGPIDTAWERSEARQASAGVPRRTSEKSLLRSDL